MANIFPELLVSLDKKIPIHKVNPNYVDDCIKCPFDYNHDPEECEILQFILPEETIYVALCGGKIRLVDGKIAGKLTKAAMRECVE